jgi:dihydrofolate synthase/folylpolyglutamate synthase
LSRAIDSYEAGKLAGSPGAVATWFDVFTAAAFVLFKGAGLEWVVVEVGIGGRLDSTNVIEGRVTIITNVELEHVDISGASREAIAREKVAILKPALRLLRRGQIISDAPCCAPFPAPRPR